MVFCWERTLWAPPVIAMVELLRISRCCIICWICEGLALVISSSVAKFPLSLRGWGDFARCLLFVLLFVLLR